LSAGAHHPRLEEKYHIQQLLEVILPGLNTQCIVRSCVGGATIEHDGIKITSLNVTQYGHLYAKGYIDEGTPRPADKQYGRAEHNEHRFTEKGLAIIRGDKS